MLTSVGGARGPGCFNMLASSIDVYKIWEIFCVCLNANMNVYRTWAILCLFKASEITGPLCFTTWIIFCRSFAAMVTGVLALKLEVQNQEQRITFTNLPAKRMQSDTEKRNSFFYSWNSVLRKLSGKGDPAGFQCPHP